MAVKKLSKSQQEVWDRLNYVPVPGNEYYRFASHAPNNPQVGEIYVDTNANQMLMYDGVTWQVMA